MEDGSPGVPASFWIYAGSRFCAGTATTSLRAAVAWHVFALSHSAFDLGLVGLVQFVPALSLTLVGGAAADAYDRRRLMRVAELAMLVCGLGLFFATDRGRATIPLLFAAVFGVSAANAFDSPARQALVPRLVPLEAFPRAVTYAATAQALAFATGPGLAGLAIARGGPSLAYALYVGLMAASWLGLGFVRPQRSPAPGRAPSWRGIREGLGFVWRHPVVLGCMCLDMFAVVFGGATALLPIFATDLLGVGARGYGLLSSSLEIGALAMAVVMMLRPTISRAGRALLVAVGVYGVATVVFGLSRLFPLSVLAYGMVGMADQVSVVMRQTMIQLATPDALRGRVSAVNMIFISASNQLGAVESGFVAAATTATFSVVSGGIACLAVLALVAWRFPELRRHQLGGRMPELAG